MVRERPVGRPPAIPTVRVFAKSFRDCLARRMLQLARLPANRASDSCRLPASIEQLAAFGNGGRRVNRIEPPADRFEAIVFFRACYDKYIRSFERR